jgi:type IV pilus assembly protein PilC
MAKFKVTTVNKEGKTVESLKEAPDKFVLFRNIKQEGHTLVSVKEIKSKNFFSMEKINELIGSVKTQEKITFARNLGAMIEAGLPLARALSVIEKQSKNEKFKSAIRALNKGVEKGNSLSDTMEESPKVFSKLFVAMVRAGEESGKLVETLKVVGDQIEQSHNLKKRIRGALMYPGIILSIMIIIGILMLIYVVPTLTSTFKELNVELPFSTQVILSISDFLNNHIITSFLLIFSIVTILYIFFRSSQGKRTLDFTLLHAPFISTMVKETNAARTSRTLASLLSSGVEIVRAIEITQDVLQNSYYKEVMEEAKEKIQKGIQLSEVFSEHEDIYPVFITEMTSVGQETGKLSEMFLRVAVFYENEIEQKTKNLSTIIEPILMVFIGAAVGFFAVSMISPTYSLIDSL